MIIESGFGNLQTDELSNLNIKAKQYDLENIDEFLNDKQKKRLNQDPFGKEESVNISDQTPQFQSVRDMKEIQEYLQ